MESFEVWINNFREKNNWLISNYEKINKLCHYTSAEALRSILENNSLWMTHINYMNDSEEIFYAIELIESCLENITNKYVVKRISDFIEKLKHEKIIKDAFLLSLSCDNDSTSLWNNYSKNGGYNISFNSSFWDEIKLSHLCFGGVELTKSNPENDSKSYKYSYMFKKVIYDDYEQIKRINIIIKAMVDLVDKDEKDLKTKLSLLEEYLFNEIYFYKRSGHNSESEYRFMIYFLNKETSKSFIKHRILNGSFVPYIELKLNKNYFDYITIGPRHNMDFVQNGLKSYLECDNKDIEVKTSNLKLRY